MVTKRKYKKSIELFHEKSGNTIRIMLFKQQKEFENFLYAYKSMRYPGYGWRIHSNGKKDRNKKSINDDY